MDVYIRICMYVHIHIYIMHTFTHIFNIRIMYIIYAGGLKIKEKEINQEKNPLKICEEKLSYMEADMESRGSININVYICVKNKFLAHILLQICML
jgi:hypothetical protein